MPKSLLFLPDISGYTKFIQTTEISHSQHVIAELLEVLIAANTENLKLAEIEGDALFFYKEGAIPSQERLLAQIEAMFTAFYSHLELLKENRICPCNACATAPELQLKIIAHCGDLQHIEVHGTRKPFGKQVIEAHRLLKNSVDSDNYVLISEALSTQIRLSKHYSSALYRFRRGEDFYDGQSLAYNYAVIDQTQLQLKPIEKIETISFDRPPEIREEAIFPINAQRLYEYIANFTYRPHWQKGVASFEFKEHEVSRLGTAHVCVINSQHLHIKTVVKPVKDGQLVYGEMTTDPPPFDAFYQFYTISPIDQNSCHLLMETYWEAASPLKKLMIFLFAKKRFKSSLKNAMLGLQNFIAEIPPSHI